MAVLFLGVAAGAGAAEGDPKRGHYLAQAAGCMGCHTEERKNAVPYAGGRALKTPFGTFYGPNITPHPEAGIGRWTERDFFLAMRHGERPDGTNYFPAFPYTSFTRIVDEDLRHLWAYLQSLPPDGRRNLPHALDFPYRVRLLVTPWKWLFFTPGPVAQNGALDPKVARGQYFVDALGHCGECHTPRNALGAMKRDRHLAGGTGPDGKGVPNLTPTRLKKVSDGELKDFLTTGVTADGDIPAEAMAEVIRNTTSQLTPSDLDAMIAYLRALAPLPDEPKKKK